MGLFVMPEEAIMGLFVPVVPEGAFGARNGFIRLSRSLAAGNL